ncbi:hypothetical protein ACEXQB_012250 [Herbiconiux sp. P18]|uniref:hypothetical protein n=1 Tax=Herbiconiux liangxiaofengii TaxID=3342795 RepID=UPI0035BC8676
MAHASRCSVGNAFKATRHLVDIGAVSTLSRGGLSVLDPERVVAVLAAERRLANDTVAMVSRSSMPDLLGSLPLYALGGTDAAIHHLGGRNTIADRGQRLLYIPEKDADKVQPHDADPDLGDEETVRIVVMDEVAQRAWASGYASFAQTYADLFSQPGWQAAEFRRALWRTAFEVDDWSQSEAARA